MSFLRSLAVGLALTAMPVAAVAQESAAQSVTLGPLVLSQGFARATLPHAPVAGGFLSIRNTGAEADRLVGASSGIAGRVEVHEMAMVGDVMKMRELKDGLPIPAGATVVLKPGGYHLMFMKLKGPLVEGQVVRVELIFEKAGRVEVPLAIGAPNAKSMPMGHMDHGALAVTPRARFG